MNERDVKLLFQADHWRNATVKHSKREGGWLVEFLEANGNGSHLLTLKRGNPRIFKSSDTALFWCRDIGFKKITVELHKPQDEKISDTYIKINGEYRDCEFNSNWLKNE